MRLSLMARGAGGFWSKAGLVARILYRLILSGKKIKVGKVEVTLPSEDPTVPAGEVTLEGPKG